MPRRSETPAERRAQERVKKRYDAQLAAINVFFTRERRIEMLRADTATLETEQGEAAAKLAKATSVAQAAEIISWPPSRVGEMATGRGATTRHARASRGTAPTEIGE